MTSSWGFTLTKLQCNCIASGLHFITESDIRRIDCVTLLQFVDCHHLRQGGYFLPGVCLPLSSFTYKLPIESSRTFYHPDLDLDLGIFEGIFAVVVRGKIRHIFANNSKSWRQNFIVFEGGMFHYQQTVQFQCSAGSRSGIFDGIFYHSRTGPISKNVEWSAALVAVCGVRMSLLLFVFLTSIAHT